MATLNDVAKKAGVSIATVSYCINNSKKVKPATRDRIMQVIEELNYIPNTSAQNLKSSISREIGVILPDMDEFCHTKILEGMIACAENTDYSLNIAFSYNTPKLERKIIDQFIGRNIAGLILITSQPNNEGYFQSSLVRNNIPAVFMERYPQNIDANFLAFDNYTSCYFLSKKLIDAGYSRIFLMTGSDEYFSESECIRGFTDAHDEADLRYSFDQLIQTSLSKEAGFRKTMFRLVSNPPQVIIASSQSLAKGIMEAFHLYHIRIPEDCCVITLGEECWNETDYLPNLIHTSRTAYTMGRHSIHLLLKNIKSPQFFEREFMLFKDNVTSNTLDIPKVPVQKAKRTPPTRTLRILAISHPTILALSAVSGEFELKHNIKIEFDFVSYRDLIDTIVADAESENYKYDVYQFDVSWLTYLANKNALADITPLIHSDDIFTRSAIKKNLENCCYKGQYYGFPIIGGGHILFYRRDLFDNSSIQSMFKVQHNLHLRPPKTWTEFNGIAKFFTKEYNAYSPTLYGTSVIGSINEELAIEIQIRLWSFGGGLYDSNGRLALDTPQNVKGFQSLLESCKYTNCHPFESSVDQSFKAFGSGKTAMLLSFTEYASHINDCIHGDIITNVDYCMLPGQTPANVGWNLGVSRQTPHAGLISDYFKYICQKKTSYYMTTLNGQSTLRHPYENHEILKSNPWLKINEESQSTSRSRIYPYQGKNRLIKPYEIESVLYEIFVKMYRKEMSIQEALRFGQQRMEELLLK